MAPHEPSPAARATLASLGIGGAALALCLAAAAPALADRPDNPGSNGNGQQQSSSTTHGNAKAHSHTSATADSTDNSSQAGDTAKTHGKSSSPHGNSSPSAGNDTSGHNPPGNNGTVFIHDVAGDSSPHNVPHVGCTFYVDFFGFDNDQQVSVSFAGQAPTGMGTALGGSWTGTVSTDDAGGAGNDFDLEKSFTADQLGVTSLGAPAHEGYHVKMTVLTGQPGPTNKKSKVFWIQPCETAAAPLAGTDNTSVGSSIVPSPGATTSVGALGFGAFGAGGQQSAGATTQATGGIPTNVLGESFTRAPQATPAGPTAAVSATGASLPFTGAEIGGLAAAAAAAIAGGAALTVAGRRRRTARLTTGS